MTTFCTRVLPLVAVAALLAAAAAPLSVGERSGFTCILCRAKRVDHSYLGLGWQEFHDTEFTRWYESRRQPHAHVWTRRVARAE